MNIVTSITNQPKQRFNIPIANNDIVRINLYFNMTQRAWYFDFQYNDYICNGNKVVLTFNAIRHLRNKLPFGIGFISESQADPFDLNDFKNNNVMMIILNQEEVEQYESLIYNV